MILKELLEKINAKLANNYNGGNPKDRSITAKNLINNYFEKPKDKGLSLRNEQRQDFVLDTEWLSSRETSCGVHFKVSRKEYRIEGQRYSWGKNFIDFKITVDEEYDFSKGCLEKTVDEIIVAVKEREAQKEKSKKEYRQERISEFIKTLKEANITFQQFDTLKYKFSNLEYEEQREFEEKIDTNLRYR